MSSSRVVPEPVAPYIARPPPWLKRTHTTADLGYSGFYPPVPNAPEEQLTDTAVREGYTAQLEVNAESFNAKGEATKSFAIGTALEDLKQLLELVIERRADNAARLPTAAFKVPGRVTFNEQRRVGWVNELADSDTPLSKIGKSVPHGFKGHDLLEMLQTNKVAVPRAVWYVRVLGANETQGMRNRPNFHPSMYSVEWANVVTSYVKKLLADIALPSAPRAGLNIKTTFKSILADPESRERWLARYTYCLDLLREFYAESLVDHCTFLSWLCQHLAGANLAQAFFIVGLMEEYTDGLLGHRAFTRPLVESWLARLSEIENSPVKENMAFLSSMIKSLLHRALATVPDAFVSPGIWMYHSTLMRDLFYNTANPDTFRDVEQRNEALIFRILPERAMAEVRMIMAEIAALNGMALDTDLHTLATRGTPLPVLFTWASSPAQHGLHRPFLVGTLLQRRGEEGEALQDALIDWLEQDDPSVSSRGAARLLGELGRVGLFSYGRFLDPVLARGEVERHRAIIREMPIWRENGVVLRQRMTALYGRQRKNEEDDIQRKIRQEIRQELPQLFGGMLPEVEPAGALKSRMPTLFGAHRFEQIRMVGIWLTPIVLEKINQGLFDDVHVALRTYSIFSELLSSTQCFSSLCDVNVVLLNKPMALELLMAVVNNLRRFAFLFKCMDVVPQIDAALAVAHHSVRSRPAQLRALLGLLEALDRGGQSTITQLVAADVEASIEALRPPPTSPEDIPTQVYELDGLAHDSAPNAPSILAHSMWTKFKLKPNWGLTAAESTFASLRDLQPVPDDCAAKFTMFLWEVDQLMAGALDACVLDCLRGPVFEDMRTCGEETWAIVGTILVELVTRGCVSTQTVLRGVCYPAWSLGARPGLGEDDVAMHAGFLMMSVKLGKTLLLCAVETAPEDDFPPRTLSDAQMLKTRRTVLYDDGDFADLVTSLRSLVAWEAGPHVALREAAASLRTALQGNREFWFIARKNLDLVRDVFLTVLPPSEALVEMLRAILGDPANVMYDPEEETATTTSWQNISSRVNPWTFARTSINLHLTLQELVKGLGEETTRAQAERDLDTFTARLFDSAVTAEETDLLADVLRGISGPVAAKFVNNGLRRLTTLLDDVQGDVPIEAIELFLKRAGEVLRLLASVIVPLRDDPSKLPAVEAEVQDAYIAALLKKFECVERRMPNAEQEDNLHLLLQTLIFLARLLQFSLGLSRPWSDKSKEYGVDLMSCLVRLAAMCGGGIVTESRAFTILLDTVSMMVDEFPKDPKTAATDLFRNLPAVEPESLSEGIPDCFKDRLRFILPYRARSPYTDDLVYITPATSDISYGPGVTNRPWEWLECLDAGATSIPLEFFGGRGTGEAALDDLEGARAGDVLQQQDTFNTGSLFELDWRQSRIPASTEADDEPTPPPAADDTHEHEQATSEAFPHEPSPAPTVLSRTSAGGFASASVSSRRGSPALAMRGRGSATTGSGTGSKRASSAMEDSSTDNGEGRSGSAVPNKRARGRTTGAGATTTRSRSKKK
ncbi:hypothetical protein AURDEDRAFT_117332 [Auricularia subglabra TFB-10046 SS5]|uniref:Mediator of RNA polymerase II transcription subunit 12 n=1 Tax=Auricularia subglabra (strain TFB-10046 / SS5) TaxID=717982 RepID=J0WTI9_AURST|nr:hypothetical protein AURDEDRAFT_117332 [Auricularia subglabra TFB-10046 SS5]